MAIKIALAGNPNSGKTTMFNDLTGSSQYVGNWPGVTVEKKEGKLKGQKDVVIQDLPGIYSLSPYTLEEVVSRNFLVKDRPEAIINIVDASNLERNLYLTTQLTEIGIPVVLALNMMDVVEKNGDVIDTDKLGEMLGCTVMKTSALKHTGTKEVAQRAIELANAAGGSTPKHTFSADTTAAIDSIEGLIKAHVPAHSAHWFAIKFFERDERVLEENPLPADVAAQVESLIAACELKADDGAQSIVTGERYDFIAKVIKQAYKRGRRAAFSRSDRIDKVVTNRFLALPIFAAIMFLVYYLSIASVGGAMTGWVNDSLFGDGFHLFGMGASAYEEKVELFDTAQVQIEAYLAAAEEAGLDIEAVTAALAFDPEAIEDEAQRAIDAAAAQADIDAFVALCRQEGITAEAKLEDEAGNVTETIPVSAGLFSAAVALPEPDPADYGTWVPGLPVMATTAMESINAAPWLQGLVVDGIIAGVGAVLGFLPQMLVLFLCLAILEDCGYMARIAFIMDRIFRKFGLSGKSFIPMLISTGCGVPGIMASRTIESDNDRRMTVMTTTFMPCGAKLPIIALIAGALFPGHTWVGPSAYFVGIAAIIVSGIMLKKTKRFVGDASPFVMELPAYHLPGYRGVLRTMFSRAWAFVKKAGSIVLLATVAIWFMSNFTWSFIMTADADASILASIGRLLAPLFVPLGWGQWQPAVATVSGLIAKENVVGTFGVLYGFAEVAENGAEYWASLQAAFTPLAGYSFLVFNLLCAPCFAAMGAIRREMNSGRWTWFAIGYQCLFAYVVALMVYQFGMLFTGGGFSVWVVAALAALVGMIYLLVKKPYADNKPLKANKALRQAS